MTVVIIRRALLGFFLVFLGFWSFLVLEDDDSLAEALVEGVFISLVVISLIVSSPPSFKSKAWMGLRKSSTVWVGVVGVSGASNVSDSSDVSSVSDVSEGFSSGLKRMESMSSMV